MDIMKEIKFRLNFIRNWFSMDLSVSMLSTFISSNNSCQTQTHKYITLSFKILSVLEIQSQTVVQFSTSFLQQTLGFNMT